MPKCSECKYHCAKCDELTDSSKGDTQHTKNDMLCWCCKHAVPKLDYDGKYIRGCEWSIHHKMPKGVTTISKRIEYIRYDEQGHKICKSGYTDVIVGCPKFERG